MSASSDAAFPSVNLIDIPSELLVSIFLYVRALDLVSLCKSCVRFRSVIMDHDHIWNSLCYRGKLLNLKMKMKTVDNINTDQFLIITIMVFKFLNCNAYEINNL